MASSATSSIDSVSEFVSRAFSIIGASYQWSGYTWTGNPFSSAFTCSGVVDFARGMPSRSSSPETLSAEVGRRMVHDASQLSYGDLVFYESLGRAPGHVGIYIGNGQIIDSIPNGGVAVRDVMYMGEAFMGGGSIYTDSTEGPDEGTPTLTDDGGHGTGTPADIDDGTPGPTKGTDVMPDPVPTSAPTTMPVSRAASPAALPETGDPSASTIAAALAVSGISGLLAGRRLRS